MTSQDTLRSTLLFALVLALGLGVGTALHGGMAQVTTSPAAIAWAGR